MKHWTKKALSLALVVIMITSMIPFAVFTTSGLDYSKSEFVITSLSDWKDIATYSAANNDMASSFAGKTIKLENDIDFKGATIPTLFANNFSGTFDGQGNTLSNFKTTTGAVIANVTNTGSVIKNLTVDGTVEYNTYHTDGTNGWQVVAGMIVNRMDAGTITDVTVAGSITSNAYNVGGVAGVVSFANGLGITLENINVSATVHNTRTRITVGWHSAGGVVGTVEAVKDTQLLIKNVNMMGTVTRDNGPAGGIIGTIYERGNRDAQLDNPVDPYTAGTINIENCQMSGTVTSATGSAGRGVGGIVGAFGVFKKEADDFKAFDGELNINNCVIDGTVQNTNTTSNDPLGVGGVIGSMAYGNATVNVEHCLVNPTFPKQSLTETDAKKSAGLILGMSSCQTMSAINVNNTVTTLSGSNMIGHVIPKQNTDDAWIVLNGKNQSSVTENAELFDGVWAYTNAIGDDGSVLTVSEDAADAMVIKQNGFIQRVGGQITAWGVQDNVDENAVLTAKDQYAIRFIGVSHVADVASASMTVVVRDSYTGKAFKKYEKACSLYDALSVYDVNGKVIERKDSNEFGAEKFLALTIGEIPGGNTYVFDFTPSYTTASGLTMTAETVSVTYDANGQYVKEKESFEAKKLVLSPTVRVMSSNILVADNSATAQPSASLVVDKKVNGVSQKVTIKFTHEERLASMAKTFNFYQPDFIGLQEVANSTQVNSVDCFDGVKTMQSVLKTYMNSAYEYVDFSAKLNGESHFTPIMYNADQWKVVESDIMTKHVCGTDCTMHRWQWARFENLANPQYQVIVMNIHSPHSNPDEKGQVHLNARIPFYTEVNAEIQALEAAYPDIPIMITGDYNANPTKDEKDYKKVFETLTNGTTLADTKALTGNYETTGIDNIFMTEGDATVVQLRQIYNTREVFLSSDHYPIFADIQLKSIYVPTPGSSMGWGEGVPMG
ncbi:MAG: hypothetical protein J6Q82_05055 [Clostridia bacterium]|nr:hypothetical protein [Clostridia bacterium]